MADKEQKSNVYLEPGSIGKAIVHTFRVYDKVGEDNDYTNKNTSRIY